MDLRQIDRRLRSIEEKLESKDLINEEEAAKWLGVAKKTLQNRVYAGLLEGTYEISKLNGRMYHKSKLIK